MRIKLVTKIYEQIWQGSSAGESARLIPVRSRVRISPLLFLLLTSRVIRRLLFFFQRTKSKNVQVFTFFSFYARHPLVQTILNRLNSAQSVRSRVRISPLLNKNRQVKSVCFYYYITVNFLINLCK